MEFAELYFEMASVLWEFGQFESALEYIGKPLP